MKPNSNERITSDDWFSSSDSNGSAQLVLNLVSLLTPFVLGFVFKRLESWANKSKEAEKPLRPAEPFRVNEVSPYPGIEVCSERSE